MKLKLSKPIIFFDIESTGLDIAKDRIVEISILKVFPDEHEECYTYRLNPQIPISEEATKVHGITNEDIKDFLAKDEIMVLKEGKKKTALCNIKEGILELKLLDNNVILMKLASGSVMNVKPIQVLAALSEFCGSSFAAESISRLEIYKNIEGKFYPLGDFSHS